MVKGRVLYVEDTWENRILIKRVLEAAGYIVIEAENGTQGMELALSSHPDLILMDIDLPDIDGYECTARLRNSDGCCNIPIVALTANAMEGDAEKSLKAGCNGHITKPVDIDTLPDEIATYLSRN